MRKFLPLSVVLLIYLVLGALYAAYTPAWETPDEPAHYNYVKQLANGRLPVIEPGDYDQEYLVEAVFESHFAPEYPIAPISYEDWQPPLYYLLQTLPYLSSGGSLLWMRLFSLAIGAAVVVFAYLTALRVFPGRRWLALTTAVFVALIPQHLAIMASVNNDSLAELLIAAMLFFLMEVGDQRRKVSSSTWMTLGALLGLGFLTKGTVYIMAFVIAGAIVWRFWRDWRAVIRVAIITFGIATLFGAIWWGRNLIVYGGLDILGKAAHDTVVVGQPRTADWIAEFGALEVGKRFLQTTFNSFWGQFGWMTTPLPGRVYQLLWLFCGALTAGLAIGAIKANGETRRNPQLWILLAVFVFSLAVHVGYNIAFVQHQGRYLYPALIPIAVGLALGLEVWLRPFVGRYASIRYGALVGLVLFLGLLNIYALFWVIVPYLA